MTQSPPPSDPVEPQGKAYEILLERALEQARKVKEKSGPVLHRMIEESSEKLAELGELTEEQAAKISEYLRRDLKLAAEYMDKTGHDFKKWLAVDTAMIEDYLFERFKEAADRTTVELLKLKQEGENAEYHSGEISGPGVLICDECGEQIHFHKASHIPPCPKCRHGRFHRMHCT